MSFDFKKYKRIDTKARALDKSIGKGTVISKVKKVKDGFMNIFKYAGEAYIHTGSSVIELKTIQISQELYLFEIKKSVYILRFGKDKLSRSMFIKLKKNPQTLKNFFNDTINVGKYIKGKFKIRLPHFQNELIYLLEDLYTKKIIIFNGKKFEIKNDNDEKLFGDTYDKYTWKKIDQINFNIDIKTPFVLFKLNPNKHLEYWSYIRMPTLSN